VIGGLAGVQLHNLIGETLISVGGGFVVALVFRTLESAGKLRADSGPFQAHGGPRPR
jgi:hypothetical protein